MDPVFKDPLHDPLELACLIAAEESFADSMVMPRHISERVHSDIEQICAPAAKRISLDKMLGNEVLPQSVAIAVASAMYGNDDAPDDGGEAGFFRGATADYYDPRNSYLDSVLERREGIPISLSLITADACSQLGCKMVGLNAPGQLLLAPADTSERWVLDPFGGGALMSEEEAATFLVARLGRDSTGCSEEQQRAIGKSVLDSLRAAPMTPLQWAARMLRNLRSIHTASGDVTRLIGVCDRLRQIGGHSRIAVSDDEMRQCAAQVALCVFHLRWTQRRSEARALLGGLLRSSKDDIERERIEDLMKQPWFEQ